LEELLGGDRLRSSLGLAWFEAPLRRERERRGGEGDRRSGEELRSLDRAEPKGTRSVYGLTKFGGELATTKES
jgi:hypothetical protein